MTHRQVRRFVGSTVLGFALAVGANVVLQGLDNEVSNSRGATGYRGIVSANFDATSADEEIVGDFGSIGLWVYHDGTWSQLTAANPEWIFAVKWGDVADWELIADFGTAGLWTWNYTGYPGSWTRLTTANADGGIAVDDDNDGRAELQIDFGTLGLWRYDYDTSTWTRYTTLNPVGAGMRVDLWVTGHEEGLWRFSGLGIWNVYWLSGNGYWTQLSPSTATEDWAAANLVDPTGAQPDDELAVEFEGLGTWVYDDDGGTWNRITLTESASLVPAKFGNNADSELTFVVNEFPIALWWWGGSVWTRLSSSDMDLGAVTPFDADGRVETFVEAELAADFGSLGLWKFDYMAADALVNRWTQLTASNPVFMVKSDYYGDGRPTALVVSFGSGVGLWLYDSGGGEFTPTWTKLTNSIPDHGLSWIG